jgi:hypothetical protein
MDLFGVRLIFTTSGFIGGISLTVLKAQPGTPIHLNMTTSSRLTLLALALAASAAALAQEKTAPASAATGATSNKPAWLTDVSLGVKEAHDDNLFLVSGDGPMSKQGSWITTISPKFGVDFAKVLGYGDDVRTLSLVYAPDIAFYHEQPNETNTAHRLTAALNGKSSDFSYTLDNAFIFVDGSSEAPVYTGLDSNRSAYATAVPRERRRQTQDRAKLTVRYDASSWFVRPCATIIDYDLMTRLSAATGYQNYVDRYDFAAGVDAGWKATKQVALTLGYRAGYQYQQQLPIGVDPTHLSSPSHFQRVLLGLEGKPLKWLTVSVQGGPDYRSYEANSTTHTTPIGNPSLVKFYGEGSITADLTANDSLTFKYKDWEWVSSTGKVPYYEGSHELAYRRKLTPKLTVDLSGKYGFSDYNSGNVASSKRFDKFYGATVAVGYAVNTRLSCSVSYAVDFGRNAEDAITNTQYREYDHHVVSASVVYKF